ncbi:IclR family transcriptional regulator [Paeniglutamicibacter cryotolerans]|uniref:DNA-binding IclR family transcriptional regulator n=1 Tax=Paeniglutamicibacter cryotolerans TaxID=670079 RepID=A0A839QIW9_9MICC|nr:IclR family transcriptional regulator [Paeniglutamicibacter cryotolerans]MBB2994485.1 DNA-binding IclR family transcriptional regulator [Paeniglutamicibacter cryotolerans]
MANSDSGDSMLDRLVRILDAFDAENPTLSVGALARRARVPRATTYRLVDELVGHGLLAREREGTLRLGLRLWELANRSSAARDLREVAMPFMEDVNQLVRQSIQLAILHDDEVLVIERLSRPGSVVNQASVAGRMPVHRTSMGMALLAFSPFPVREGYLERHGTVISALHVDLRRELAHIRLNGYATFDGFIDSESTGASVPVLDAHGHALAVLAVVVPRGSESLPAAVMALRTASRGISRALRA